MSNKALNIYSLKCKCEEGDQKDNTGWFPPLKKLLPVEYKYHVCIYEDHGNNMFSVRLRINCHTKEDILDWLHKFENKSFTTFRVSKTYPKQSKVAVFKKDLHCQHNTNPKRSKKPGKKHTSCPASLRVIVKCVKKSKSYESVDPHLNLFPAVVILHHKHNHDLFGEVLKYRDPSNEVRQKFLKMFEAGHTPSQALYIHKDDLMKEFEDDYPVAAADRAICPNTNWAFNLHYTEFRKNHKVCSVEDMLAFLETSMNKYNQEVNDQCVEFEWVTDDDYVIVLVSPLMKRILKMMKTSCDIVFMDSSEKMNRFGCKVFLLFIDSYAGGFPIGIIITNSENEQTIYQGLQIYKKFLSTNMFNERGEEGPLLFVTDDSLSEQYAIRRAFPNSNRLLSIFHILQACWKHLWSTSSDAEVDDRKELFYLVVNMLYSNTRDDLENSFKVLQTSEVSKKYIKFLKHASTLYDRRHEWALGYQENSVVNDQNFNDICEAATRVLKDKVLLRSKAYNLSQLFDFLTSDFEDFYIQKAADVAEGRAPSYLLCQDSKVRSLSVTKVGDNYFEILNSCTKQKYYIDTSVGLCSCMVGQTGAICIHQQTILNAFDKEEYCLTVPTTEDVKEELLFIAYGSTGVPKPKMKRKTASLNVTNYTDSEGASTQETDSTAPQINNTNRNEINDALKALKNFCEKIETKVLSGAIPADAILKFTQNVKAVKSDSLLTTAFSTFGKVFWLGLSDATAAPSVPASYVHTTFGSQKFRPIAPKTEGLDSEESPKQSSAEEHPYSKSDNSSEKTMPQKRKADIDSSTGSIHCSKKEKLCP